MKRAFWESMDAPSRLALLQLRPDHCEGSRESQRAGRGRRKSFIWQTHTEGVLPTEAARANV